MSTSRVGTFLGGVAAELPSERELAFRCGRAIGKKGLTLYHGGYNGLMEDVARGASMEGVDVVAITLAHKKEWGPLNPYVTRSVFVTNMGERLNTLFSTADVVIAMGGGVGTLHEIASAIWYAGNIRRIPVVLLGSRAVRLVSALRQERWIYESPTRPSDFLLMAHSAEELDGLLGDTSILSAADHSGADTLLEARLLETAMVKGHYVRADGTLLNSHFDPFRLCADPALVQSTAIAVAAQVSARIDAVAGIALGGVPLATHVAMVVGKPLLVVRPGPKAYGINAQVEGLVSPGSRVLLVDDVVRRGTAMMSAQTALTAAELNVSEAACILRRGDHGKELLRRNNVTLHALVVRDDCDEGMQGDPSGDY
jgi:uncharacterized protein (TIGR00725 family)